MRIRQNDIQLYVRRWRKHLDLENWQIRVLFGPLEQYQTATCEAYPAYEFAKLTFDLDWMRQVLYNQVEVEEVVVHELVHCVVWKASERAVTQMARALLRAAGRW